MKRTDVASIVLAGPLAALLLVSSGVVAQTTKVNGLITGRTGSSMTVQTPTDRLVVSRSDVEAVKGSENSLMPEGLLDTLKPQEIRDLVAYLMSPQQVPLAAEATENSKPGK